MVATLRPLSAKARCPCALESPPAVRASVTQTTQNLRQPMFKMLDPTGNIVDRNRHVSSFSYGVRSSSVLHEWALFPSQEVTSLM